MLSHLSNNKVESEVESAEDDSKISYLEDNRSRDMINGPDLLPQQNSCHLNSSKSLDRLPIASNNSFK